MNQQHINLLQINHLNFVLQSSTNLTCFFLNRATKRANCAECMCCFQNINYTTYWPDLPDARQTPCECLPSWLRLGEQAGCWGRHPWRNRDWVEESHSFWMPQNHGSPKGTVSRKAGDTNTDDGNNNCFCTSVTCKMVTVSGYNAQIRCSCSGQCRAVVRHCIDWNTSTTVDPNQFNPCQHNMHH